MNKLKKGDKVKIVDYITLSEGQRDYIGKTFTVSQARDEDSISVYPYSLKGLPSHINTAFNEKELQKIGGSMSKYEALKQRIEAVVAWDKETDDILLEIKTYHSISFGQDENCDGSHPCGKVTIKPKRKDDESQSFTYHSQCEKLEAFKKTLLWLLDHSDIPKVDKEREGKIDKLEAKMDELKQELEELRK